MKVYFKLYSFGIIFTGYKITWQEIKLYNLTNSANFEIMTHSEALQE